MRELLINLKKVIRNIWGIGERIFGHDYKTRMMIIYDCLIKCMMMHGAEVWGWGTRENGLVKLPGLVVLVLKPVV